MLGTNPQKFRQSRPSPKSLKKLQLNCVGCPHVLDRFWIFLSHSDNVAFYIVTLRRKAVVFLTEKGYFLRVVMRGHPVVDTVRK
jgi:hypothetical protein